MLTRRTHTRLSQFRHYATESKRNKIVILGTGWSAFRMVKSLNKKHKVVVVSPRNHFLFTPLLPSTTTGTLEFRSIVEPIRESSILKYSQYYQAKCTKIEPERNVIQCQGVSSVGLGDKFEVDYDQLVISIGAINNTFGIPGVKENALFLKELKDARKIRIQLINCFERASVPSTTSEERKRLLSCVVVGGGPTGVEFAGELCDFIWRDLPRAFPEIRPNEVRVTLLEAGHGILPAFSQILVNRALRSLKKQGVDVRTDSRVTAVHPGEIEIDGKHSLPYGTLVWSTGLGSHQLIEDSPLPKERGRLVTDNFLRVEGTENIYAMGDCASPKGMFLPPTAQVAQQQGKYLANYMNNHVLKQNSEPPKEFKFHYVGLMTYVGSWESLIDTPAMKSSGFLAWVAWRGAYLTRLGSVKNKLQVPFDWLRSWIFGRDVTLF